MALCQWESHRGALWEGEASSPARRTPYWRGKVSRSPAGQPVSVVQRVGVRPRCRRGTRAGCHHKAASTGPPRVGSSIGAGTSTRKPGGKASLLPKPPSPLEMRGARGGPP